MPKIEKLEEPVLLSAVSEVGWKAELTKLLRSLTILVVVAINKIKEKD